MIGTHGGPAGQQALGYLTWTGSCNPPVGGLDTDGFVRTGVANSDSPKASVYAKCQDEPEENFTPTHTFINTHHQ